MSKEREAQFNPATLYPRNDLDAEDENEEFWALNANQVGWILESLTTLAKSETRGVLERDCEVLGVFLRIMNILNLEFKDKEAARDALPGMYAFDILKGGGNNEK